jgi:hypothetical protein
MQTNPARRRARGTGCDGIIARAEAHGASYASAPDGVSFAQEKLP